MRKWIDLFERYDELESAMRNSGTLASQLTDIERIEQPVWCAHFSYEAEDIARHGFTKGNPLATNWVSTSANDHHGEGYNFAVETSCEMSMDFWSVHAHEAVIFRTTGVRSYHYDEFFQIIFWGPDVIRPIYVIKCTEESYMNAEDCDWVVTQINGNAHEGEPMNFWSLISAIEAGQIS